MPGWAERGVYRWRRKDGNDDEDDAGKEAGIRSSEDGRNIKTISLWEKRLCEKNNKKKIKLKKKKKKQKKMQGKVEKHCGNDANKSRNIQVPDW